MGKEMNMLSSQSWTRNPYLFLTTLSYHYFWATTYILSEFEEKNHQIKLICFKLWINDTTLNSENGILLLIQRI